MRKILMAATSLVLAAMIGSGAAAAVPSGDTAQVPPASTAARPHALPGAITGVAAASAAPYFTGYLVCFGGYVYTDFTDPDGDDTKLNVQVWALRRSNSTWAATWMLNTGPGAHGVFFWLFPPSQPGRG